MDSFRLSGVAFGWSQEQRAPDYPFQTVPPAYGDCMIHTERPQRMMAFHNPDKIIHI